jgi:16S rRNA G966 N2-methylase RsmD
MASDGNSIGRGVSKFICADSRDWLREQPDDSVDLVFCSPPYEDARLYEINFNLTGQDWVDWASPIYKECVRVSRGLVAWVVDGKTKNYRWSATPALFMADLHRADVHLRKPPLYRRDGIPGSGGPDWLKNTYEFIICAGKGGKLHWSDTTSMGHPPKYAPGGNPSHRLQNGQRVQGSYKAPARANPGNIINCGAAGGGNIGSSLAHENEAPFAEHLAEFFIRTFCPPGGTVVDIFSGSGTVACVAHRLGRNSIGVDIRENQVELGRRRLAETQLSLIA